MASVSPRPPLIHLANDALRVAVDPRGAELASLRRQKGRSEYLWQGNPAFWSRRAPLLFPIVGALRDGGYSYWGVRYRMPQHGFARDQRFVVADCGETTVTLRLDDDETTRASYPFSFHLTVTYRLLGEAVAVEVTVANPGHDELLFSLGGHPGFACPLDPSDRMEDYLVELEVSETLDRWPVVGGLIAEAPEPFLSAARVIALAPGLFERGALVFKGLRSRRVWLVRRDGSTGVELAFDGFPYFGIWSKPGAPFVCLEPWCGIADSVSATGLLEAKEGIVRLAPGERFARTFRIRPF